VHDDDEIIAGYEEEFAEGMPDGLVSRHPRRGFWMVAGALSLGCVILVVEIFANRPYVNAISHTEHDLRVARAEADRIFSDSGTFEGAGAGGLAAVDSTRTYLDADRSASGAGTVSVYASATAGAAAARTSTGTCFMIKQTTDQGVRYRVADGACTGRAALAADQSAW